MRQLKLNKKFSFSVALATFQVLYIHMWPGLPLLDDTNMGDFYHCRKVLVIVGQVSHTVTEMVMDRCPSTGKT